jgi:hypothetical protein
MRTVEKIVGRPLSWYCELVHNAGFTGEYAFVVVDPQTQKCLTFQSASDGKNVRYFLHVAGTVIYYEDLVRLVAKLLNHIQPQ